MSATTASRMELFEIGMTAAETSAERPADAPTVDALIRWLDDVATSNVATSIVLARSRSARGGAPVRVVTVRGPSGLTAVAVRTPSPASRGAEVAHEGLTLEAVDPASAERAFHAARGEGPVRIVCGANVEPWVRGQLTAHGPLPRSHTLVAMRCARLAPSARPRGRFAEPRDEAQLRAYEAAYNAERRTNTAFDWPQRIATGQVAVLEEDGAIASVALKSGETARVACIGGMFTFPAHRRRGLGAALTAFLVARRLDERAVVHLVVDDDNAAAIALYRSLGFEEVGQCFIGYMT